MLLSKPDKQTLTNMCFVRCLGQGLLFINCIADCIEANAVELRKGLRNHIVRNGCKPQSKPESPSYLFDLAAGIVEVGHHVSPERTTEGQQ